MSSSRRKETAGSAVTVAAIHAASVPFDARAGAEKACSLIAEAAGNGAQLVVFPESFLPVFPLWNALLRPIDGHDFFRRMAGSSISVPGSELATIADAAAAHGVFVSLGFSEVSPDSAGCLWNSNVLIGDDGRLLNHHRKLVPTFYEKLTWTGGDGAGLRVSDTRIGRIGGLICGENNNTLARYTLMAQDEQIHTASYPPVWPFRNPLGAASYDLPAAIRLRAGAHSFEAKVYTVVSAGLLDEATVAAVTGGDEEAERILRASPRTAAMITGPGGEVLAEGSVDREDIVCATVDPAALVEHKQHHDMAGYYNRLDVFELNVNRTRRRPVTFTGERITELAEHAGASAWNATESGRESRNDPDHGPQGPCR